VQLLLGRRRVESTVRYLGIEIGDAIEIAARSRSNATGQCAAALPSASTETRAMLRAQSIQKQTSMKVV
jgi:hypothetical protein